MRIVKIMLITLVLGSVGVMSLGCNSKSDTASVAQNQIVTVKRGNLSVDITGSGNLALSLTEDLAFELAGTVEEVMVEAGDTVEKGKVLVKLDTSEWENELITLQRDLLQAQINLKNAEYNLSQAQNPVSTSGRVTSVVQIDPLDVAIKQLQVQLAQSQLEDAQKALDEAIAASPEITAPFDGFITAVNVAGGDEVKKGTVAVTIADPNKFEVDVMVSEMDILQVKVGGVATVQANAMAGISLSAKVTHISPTATIQSGVVNYKVTFEVQSLEAVQLRDGLTVTVSIIIQERNKVLLVPNAAINYKGGKAYVQVSEDGIAEERAIQTGISNWQYTEVTSGLSEGEKVVVPQGTTTTTTSKQSQSSGVIRIPGVGR